MWFGSQYNCHTFIHDEKIGVERVKPTNVYLQLANWSKKIPYGIVEDILVKVDKFILPSDFVVLDMDEDSKVRLIFGRLIDVQQDQLML